MSAGVAEIMRAANQREERAAHVERVLRALRITGRRLVKVAVGWSVQGGGDRRRKARLVLEDAEVVRLAEEGKLLIAGEDVFVLAGVNVEPHPPVQPWVFITAGMRRTARYAGIGFMALALRARKGEGPLTMRHVQAGLRMIADVERRETSRGLTMDWDAGPVDRQRRGGGAGGLRGSSAQAQRRLRRVKALAGAEAWSVAWAVCIEGASLRGVQARFALLQRDVGKTVAAALEAVALAYES